MGDLPGLERPARPTVSGRRIERAGRHEAAEATDGVVRRTQGEAAIGKGPPARCVNTAPGGRTLSRFRGAKPGPQSRQAQANR